MYMNLLQMFNFFFYFKSFCFHEHTRNDAAFYKILGFLEAVFDMDFYALDTQPIKQMVLYF